MRRRRDQSLRERHFFGSRFGLGCKEASPPDPPIHPNRRRIVLLFCGGCVDEEANAQTPLLVLSWSAAAVVLAVGCGGVSGPPKPRLIAGGGVGDGKIRRAPLRPRHGRGFARRALERLRPRRRRLRPVALHGADRFDRPRQVRARQLRGAQGAGDADGLRDRLRARHLDRRQRRERHPPDPADESAGRRQRHGQRDDRRLGQPAGAGREPPDAGADRLFAVEHAGRSRQRDRPGDARRQGRQAPRSRSRATCA